MNSAVLRYLRELTFMVKELRDEFINPYSSRFLKMIEEQPYIDTVPVSEQENDRP